MRKLKNFLLTIFIIIVAYWLLKKSAVLPSLPDIFVAKAVVIDETPIVLKEIKSIGQLITYTSFDEVVADTTIFTPGSAFVNGFNSIFPVPFLPSADKQLVLIGKGKVLAGTDLSLLSDSSITIKKDTITILLPKPRVLETIVNPSDLEIFVEKGQWSSQEVTLVKLQVRRKLEARALQQNILAKADAKAKAILQDFLGSMGYKYVVIN